MSIKIAHVGAGYWGTNLVRNFAQLGTLGGIVDTDAEHARRLSAEHDVNVMSIDEALTEPSISGISFATPAETHASMAIQALAAGKHVFLEKPLALNVRDGEAVLRRAKEAGKILMVGHLLQYHAVFMRLRAMAEAGELGKIQHIYSNRMSLGKFRLEENVWWSFAPHDISMVLSLVGEEPKTVTAQGGSYVTPGIFDWATSQFTFPGGARAHFNISWYHPFKEQRLVVIGDKGMAVFEDSQPEWKHKLALYRHDLVVEDGFVPVPNKAETEYIDVERSEPLKSECAHFIECIETGQTPRTDGVEALAVLRALEMGEAALQASPEV